MKLVCINKISKMLSGMIKSQSKSKTLNLDLGNLLNLVTEHLVHCPKIKFARTCPKNGSNHAKSVELTTDFLNSVASLLTTVSQSENINIKFDFKRSKADLARLMMCVLLSYQHEQRKPFWQFLEFLSSKDPSRSLFQLYTTLITVIQSDLETGQDQDALEIMLL